MSAAAALLVLAAGTAVFADAPTLLTAPLSLLTLAVVAGRLAAVRGRGPVDMVLLACGGLLVTMVLLGFLLGITGAGLHPHSWALALTGVGLAGLSAGEFLGANVHRDASARYEPGEVEGPGSRRPGDARPSAQNGGPLDGSDDPRGAVSTPAADGPGRSDDVGGSTGSPGRVGFRSSAGFSTFGSPGEFGSSSVPGDSGDRAGPDHSGDPAGSGRARDHDPRSVLTPDEPRENERWAPRLRDLPWAVAVVAVAVVALTISVRATNDAEVSPLQMTFGSVRNGSAQILVSSDETSGQLELRTQAPDGTSLSYPLFSVGPGRPVSTSVVLPSQGRFVITLNNPDQSKPLRSLILDR
ncbi:hypothetical protein [Kineosporia mesophila]|uniref:hypothetical protein n=1 Tax=Kineosporia mesophila TaxID=566012 RepID=UPI001E51FE08|nr:hypothetical protein [Kineosporia mesophila]MCD5352579.1 hypothetical protein [Kineosporia mesophila]